MAHSSYRIPVAVHPGNILEEWLEEQEMTCEEFATQSHLPHNTLCAFLRGEAPVTASLAQELSQATGIAQSLWENLQALYEKNLKENSLHQGEQAFHERYYEGKTPTSLWFSLLKEIMDLVWKDILRNQSQRLPVETPRTGTPITVSEKESTFCSTTSYSVPLAA